MFPDYAIEAALVLSVVAVVYHHVGYPILLRRLAAAAERPAERSRVALVDASTDQLPSIVVIVPAHNEQDVIAQKIENISRLVYPADRLRVVIALDGCTDATRAIADAAIARVGRGIDIQLVEYAVNRGKISVLNDQIALAEADIVALNDASGMIDPEALSRAARHFMDARIGVVCATYQLPQAGSAGEAAYWRMQTRIKAYEAAIAAPMGAHGALYFIRRSLWQPLPADTINDDFILPMQIVANGYRSVYDPSIIATEVECSQSTQEFNRRVRIGAGNMQQLVRLIGLADPREPGMAFVFLSGKGLRPIIPFLIVLAVVATLVLALRGDGLFQLLLVGEAAVLGGGALASHYGASRLPKPLAWLSYAVIGHTASAVGAVAFLTGRWNGPWMPAATSADVPSNQTSRQLALVPPAVARTKRVVDVVAAIFGLLLLAILYFPIALAIKLESRGPVLFRQRRVGRSTPTATYMFDVVKFRSMHADAEKLTGPVFAERGDPRITRVGAFLRKTRLDELPQFINVMKGEMALVGPRPERSCFVRQLDQEIPFYPERTSGLRPGITGLAQVNQSYEESVNDVSTKVAYDHAYALRLTSFRSWIVSDCEILANTVRVVFRCTGQ